MSFFVIMKKEVIMAETKAQLIQDLIDQGVLKNLRIIEAFKKVDRADFVLPESKDIAYMDAPLDIGYGATVSQPQTVALMLEIIQPNYGDKILDIGSGSGWQAALMAACGAKVISLEVVPALHEMAKKNIAKYKYSKKGLAYYFFKKGLVKLVLADATWGYKPEAPYDKIIAGAAAKEIPQAWKEQLKIGGKLLAPIRTGDSGEYGHIVELDKISDSEFKEKKHEGFMFVPLRSEK